MKGASGDAKSELNKQVQGEVKTLKGLKDATAAAQEKCAFHARTVYAPVLFDHAQVEDLIVCNPAIVYLVACGACLRCSMFVIGACMQAEHGRGLEEGGWRGKHRLLARLLRTKSILDSFGPAKRRVLCQCTVQYLHFRPHFSG